MQKITYLFVFAMILLAKTNAQQKSFDQSVQLKNCNIRIDANSFIATTFIEMEFYNPQDKEVEGAKFFNLNNGQVITAFQLELNGKYKEGSIEERWKARSTYSTIVGKRVDPALLQMDYINHYSLHIYPIAAHGSRKINFTITQLMQQDNGKAVYHLPLEFSEYTDSFKLYINVNSSMQLPVSNPGLIKASNFFIRNEKAELEWNTTAIQLNKPISFFIPINNNGQQLCTSTADKGSTFILNILPDVSQYFSAKPETIAVFWDVSLSSEERDKVKELEFLKKYIETNNINKAVFTLFNQKIVKTIQYTRSEYNFNAIKNYLLEYPSSGATNYNLLDLASVQADAILLFSDGIASWGNNKVSPATIPVNCITTRAHYNSSALYAIIGKSGGAIIDLNTKSIEIAIKKIEQSENFLYGYKSSGNSVKINETFPYKLGNNILLSGSFMHPDTLYLQFGNSNRINKIIPVYLPGQGNCAADIYKKMEMLKQYETFGKQGYWDNLILFGLQEKVVTIYTSYLVLEKAEDYIKYKIAPPKDLEEKCAEMNYVYKSEYRQREIKKQTAEDVLQNVVNIFNVGIKWWDANEPLIDLSKPAISTNATTTNDLTAITGTVKGATAINMGYTGEGFNNGAGSLKEVVVTVAFGIKRAARSTATNVQNINGEQLYIIRESNINNALAGKVAGMQVRSQSVGKLGVESLIRLRGENGLGTGGGALYVVDGTIMPSAAEINIDDVEDVTVLQGPAAAALFGPEGANGAIVINSKKARRAYSFPLWSEYKLSNVPDVEYMEQIKKSSKAEMWFTYEELQSENKKNTTFYFDMADYFFEKSMDDMATTILFDGIELSNGSIAGLKAAAYILERHKKFTAAIEIYKDLLVDNKTNLLIYRDLALAYYQNKQYQQAVDTYYAILTSGIEENYGAIDIALNEMNAIIAAHLANLDISKINSNLIKALPVDMKISLESNYGSLVNMQVVEPDGEVCNYTKPDTRSGGHFSRIFEDYNYYWNYYYNDKANEYVIKNALLGKYRIKLNVYNRISYNQSVPNIVRIISFKNFQRTGQALNIENVIVDNQYGEVEIGDVKW